MDKAPLEPLNEPRRLMLDNSDQDMVPWLCQKLDAILDSTVHLCDPGADTNAQLHRILHMSLRVFGFLHHRDLDTPENVERILTHGVEGYLSVLEHHDLLRETSTGRVILRAKHRAEEETRQRRVIHDQLLSLLEGSPSHRTRIYDLLRAARSNDYLQDADPLDELDELIEEVTMGRKSWEDFVPEARRVARLLLQQSPEKAPS